MTSSSDEPLKALVEQLSQLVLAMQQNNRLILELVEQNGDLIQMQLAKEDEEPMADLAGRPLR